MEDLQLKNKGNRFQKTKEEREQLKMLKKAHNEKLREAGADPKKVMNVKPLNK